MRVQVRDATEGLPEVPPHLVVVKATLCVLVCVAQGLVHVGEHKHKLGQ